MEQYIFLVNIIFLIFNFLLTIKINRDAEKIKYEMQRKYLNLEIKARNLLEIYPKLYGLIAEAGHLVSFFDCINKEVTRTPGICANIDELKSSISLVFGKVFLSEDLGGKKIAAFSDYLERSSLFVSDPVYERAFEIKKQLSELYSFVTDISDSEKYKNYTCEDILNLLNRGNEIIAQFNKNKEIIGRKMNKELDPI